MFVPLAVAAVTVALASPASAVAWRPVWSKHGPQHTTLTSDFSPVSVLLKTHVKSSAKAPWTKGVEAWVTGPGGWKRSLSLKLWKGQHHADGDWSNWLSLPPQTPAGNYSVGFLATSNKGQKAWRGGAASFSVGKVAHAPLTLLPGSPVKMTTTGRDVTARFFSPTHSTAAYTTVTGPNGKTFTAGFSLVSGNVDYGMWQANVQLPTTSAPGAWKVRTAYATAPGSGWLNGPAASFNLRQLSGYTVTAKPTTIKRGSPVVLSGRLTGRLPNGTYGGLAKRRLQLMFRWNAGGASPQKINSVTTDAKGGFRLSGYAVRPGWMWLTWAGDSLYQPGTSRGFWITIKK
ncbi:hypothetical protein EBO15_17480 [Actinomadura harenae]|uniref:Htaa domain-containing protein n=1 Tax=Actinomadura harenae TaxID=2483351 RepID=A0A3M2M1T9_9ACTN|nr:hypothetical protein EBO15_17480 [Actinomadura harenae]